MYKFIWDDKPDKLKREISVLNYDKGGLKILDLQHFITSLKSTWIRKYVFGNGKWKYILENEVDMSTILHCGTTVIEEKSKKLNNPFWMDIFKCWKSIIDKYESKEEINVLKTPIWYNNKIKIGNKTVFYSEWFIKGVRYINDLVNEENKFYSYIDFRNKYEIRTDFLTYHGIINTIKTIVKQADMLCVKRIQ